jgi:hypothetical protein
MDAEITEAWLSEETGLSRSVLREFREKNLSAADWRTGARNMVVWERSALGKARGQWRDMNGLIEKILTGGEPAEAGAEVAEYAPERAEVLPEVVQASVVRKFANPHLIEARTDTTAILVRVHNNENFVSGMSIRARRPKASTSPWVLEGRCPRWPGRF